MLIFIKNRRYYYSKKIFSLKFYFYGFFIVYLMTIACYFLSRILDDFSIESILFTIFTFVSFVIVLFFMKIFDTNKINYIL